MYQKHVCEETVKAVNEVAMSLVFREQSIYLIPTDALRTRLLYQKEK